MATELVKEPKRPINTNTFKPKKDWKDLLEELEDKYENSLKSRPFILQEYNNNTIEEEVMHEYDGDYDDDNNPIDPIDYESDYYAEYVLELLERNRL